MPGGWIVQILLEVVTPFLTSVRIEKAILYLDMVLVGAVPKKGCRMMLLLLLFFERKSNWDSIEDDFFEKCH